jgi:hypothetical protein
MGDAAAEHRHPMKKVSATKSRQDANFSTFGG